MKELTIFTKGDSSQINTWSNVPYFFTETLISKGVKVNRVDCGPPLLISNIFDRTWGRFIRKFTKNKSYDFVYSYIYYLYARHRINKTSRQFPNSEANIFLTFLFSSVGISDKPSILFCDWTYDYRIKFLLSRKPGFWENQSIKRQTAQITGSDLVISLFPRSAEYMTAQYNSNNIHYIGNVINSLCDAPEEEILKLKEKSNKILFIGSEAYIEGAEALILAFEILAQQFPELELHLIGIKESDLKHVPENTHCYGYLDKGIDSERELYYTLLKNAKLFINTTPKWAAFSASIEAMYFYTPVIVTPTLEFVETFGQDIEFGFYCKDNLKHCIAEKVEKLMNDKDYKTRCCKAHNAVREFTWSEFVNKMSRYIENTISSR